MVVDMIFGGAKLNKIAISYRIDDISKPHGMYPVENVNTACLSDLQANLQPPTPIDFYLQSITSLRALSSSFERSGCPIEAHMQIPTTPAVSLLISRSAQLQARLLSCELPPPPPPGASSIKLAKISSAHHKYLM